jgi:hypothetical protein
VVLVVPVLVLIPGAMVVIVVLLAVTVVQSTVRVRKAPVLVQVY